MRGKVLGNDENLKGYYYDWISRKIDSNGIKSYEYSTIPYIFNFSDSSTSGSTVFSSTKGLEETISNVGVYQTNVNKWTIQTSNTEIPFKVGGKIVLNVDGTERTFLITKRITLTSYLSGVVGKRPFINSFNKKDFPVVLEIS